MTDVANLAAQDQRHAAYRDYAAECAAAYYQFICEGFTQGQSMELLHRLLDGREERCDAST